MPKPERFSLLSPNERLMALPVPDRGTVVIMRLEDFIAIEQQPTAKPSRHASTKTPMQSRVRAAEIDQVKHWLSGNGPIESYSCLTTRDRQGCVVSTTAEAVALACPVDPGRSMERKLEVAGWILTQLGWPKRYLTIPGEGRRRIYLAPERCST